MSLLPLATKFKTSQVSRTSGGGTPGSQAVASCDGILIDLQGPEAVTVAEADNPTAEVKLQATVNLTKADWMSLNTENAYRRKLEPLLVAQFNDLLNRSDGATVLVIEWESGKGII